MNNLSRTDMKLGVVGWPLSTVKHLPSLFLIHLSHGAGTNQKEGKKTWHHGNDSLITKQKLRTDANQKGFHSLPPTGRQISNHFLHKNRSSLVYVTFPWEDQLHNLKHPLLPPPVLKLLLIDKTTWTIPLVSLGCIPLQLLADPRLIGESLDALPTLYSNRQNTGVLSSLHVY